MGEVIYSKVQYGIETSGSAGGVAATAMWPGNITVPADRRTTFKDIKTGSRARAFKGSINRILVDGWTLSMPDGYFQKLPLLGKIGLLGTATGSSLSGGALTDYQWDFTPNMTTTNSLKSATIEYGDNTQAFEINWSQMRRLTFSGTLGTEDGVSVEAEGFAQQISKATFTAGLSQSPTTLEPMVANMTKFYVDNLWADRGGTIKTDVLRAYTVVVETGAHPKFTATGSKTFNQVGEGYMDVTATFTYEENATGVAEYDAFTSGSARTVRLEVIGSTITGTANTHKLTLDIYGTCETVVPMSGDQDGNNLMTAVLHGHSNGSAVESMFAMKVITNVNSV
jgi:hypothetical protein